MGFARKEKNLEFLLRRRKIWLSFPPIFIVYSAPLFLFSFLLQGAETNPLEFIRGIIITVAVLATIIVVLMLMPNGPLKMDGSRDLRYSGNRAWLTSKVLWVLLPALLYFAYFQLEPLDEWVQSVHKGTNYGAIFVSLVIGTLLIQAAGLSLSQLQLNRFLLTPRGRKELSERNGWVDSISSPTTRKIAAQLNKWRYMTGGGPVANGLQVMKLKQIIKKSHSVPHGENLRFDQFKNQTQSELEGVSRRKFSFTRMHRNLGWIYRWPISILVLFLVWDGTAVIRRELSNWFKDGTTPEFNFNIQNMIYLVLLLWAVLVQFFPNRVDTNRLNLNSFDRAAESWLNFFQFFAFNLSAFIRKRR